MSDCIKCRDYKDCKGPYDYYYPGEIQFCRWQMLWLLWHLEELQSDIYPSLTSSYIDWPPNLAEGSRNGAYFETPAGLAAVITQRLERTKKDGKLLLAQVKAQFDDTADALCRCYEELDKNAKLALGYISGRWPKKLKYTDWKKQRVYRSSMTTKRLSRAGDTGYLTKPKVL